MLITPSATDTLHFMVIVAMCERTIRDLGQLIDNGKKRNLILYQGNKNAIKKEIFYVFHSQAKQPAQWCLATVAEYLLLVSWTMWVGAEEPVW